MKGYAMRIPPHLSLSRKAVSYGMTLIEILVVFAIISFLAAALLPALGRARAKGRQAACINNLKQMGIAMFLYAEDWKDYLPCPTSAFGEAGCWFYAIDAYTINIKTPAGGATTAQKTARYKQDPVWQTFTASTQASTRTIKMNRKLVGNSSESPTIGVASANPPYRKLREVQKLDNTPLLFDARSEEPAASSTDKSRFDGWEVYVGLRHSRAADILFCDGRVQIWTAGVPQANGMGWVTGSTPLDWWVQ